MARPTIGFLINDLASTYQYELWCGVDAACRERGLELVVFTGGEIGSDDPVKAVRNRVFNLANARNVQGLVVGAPAVGNYLTHDQAADYCRSLGLPVVTIGIELPGIPAVLVDNTAGMQRLVEHLVVDHGRRKIAFVGGSVENPEAQARLQAYRDVLARHGLGPDAALEVVANWDHGFATHLTLELIRNVPGLDAVVAANDDMALGAMEAVKKAGLSSPRDITICGFDDIEDARFSSPTLSTVRQPMGEQGRHAVDMVLALIDGKAAAGPQVKYLPADFVARKSCGCVSDELMHAFLRPDAIEVPETRPEDAALAADLEAGIAAHAPDIARTDRMSLVQALIEDVRASHCEGSFQAFEKVIRATPFQSEKLLALQSLVNAERGAMLPAVAMRGAPQIAAESIWHQKRMMIAEAAVGAEAYQRVQHERLVRVLQVMSAQLTTTFNIDALLSQLRYHLPLIGISTAYLLLECDGDCSGEESKPLRLMMAIEEGRPLPMPEEGLRVRAGSLFPEGYVRAANRRTLVTEPLAFHDTPLGYFAYELPPKRGQVFDALRTMISGAIQGARLVKQVQKRTEELEVANLDLSNTNQKVRDILENIEQALFTVNLDGSINRESSRSVRTVLGIDDPSRAELRDLLHLTREQERDFFAWLDLVEAKHASMRWEKLTRLAPVQDCEIVVDGATRFIRIRYQRMFDSRGTLDKIMVLAVDETESRRVEQLIAAQREQHENEVKTIIGLVHNLPESIADYLADAEARVRRVQERFHAWLERARAARAGYPSARPFLADEDEVAELGRDLHTLKGNSATYGFERISKLAHEAEDLLEALKPPVEVRSTTTLEGLAAKSDALAESLADVERTRRKLSDSESGAMLRIPEAKIDGVRDLAASLAARGEADPELRRLLAACAGLRDLPLARLADKYRKLVERLGARLGKNIELVVSPVDLDLDPHFFSPIDEALVHILRNSVDHGLEIPEDRRDAGKPETGRIAIEVERRPGAAVVRVRDDGRGIDVGRVVAKAIEKGLVTAAQVEAMSAEERLGLVFRSGVSTAAAVSDISGRGVGMDAVRDCLAKLGGSIRVTSETGVGSCLELSFPA